MYNNGIQLLLQGKFTLAFRCFHASSRLFFNRPKLWLRLGECCTAAFTEKQKHNACLGNKSGLIQGIVGSGAHRRVLLPTRIPSSESQDIIGTSDTAKSSSTGSSSAVAQSTTTTPDGLPRMNLPFAAKCFKNVVLLCTQLLAQDVSKKEDTTNSMASSQDPSVTSSSEVITTDSTDELDFLRQKALVNLAFVYLSMYEPHLAITHAKQLLDIPSCSKTNRFLACSYQAEALCMLSQSSEATEIFQSERDLIYMADEYAKEAKQSVSFYNLFFIFDYRCLKFIDICSL
jgi:CCR4-NOT transcription complex subunit 10